MRIATNQFRNQAVTTMVSHQAELGRLQEQASTGRRVNRASDDPLAVAEAERLRSAQARVEIEKRAMSYAKNLMAQGESALASGILALQEGRDTMISAGNAIRSESDRASLGQKLIQLRNELFTLANQHDHEGGYLFGGSGTAQMPFPSVGDSYSGGPGVRMNGLNVSFLMNLSGEDIFQGFGADGRGTIFQELDKVINALHDTSVPQEDLMEVLHEGMGSIDHSLRSMQVARSALGEELRIMESRERVISAGELSTAQRRSELVDTDYATVLSDTQSRSVALQAAMQTYSQVSQLTLFNYL